MVEISTLLQDPNVSESAIDFLESIKFYKFNLARLRDFETTMQVNTNPVLQKLIRNNQFELNYNQSFSIKTNKEKNIPEQYKKLI